MNQTELARAIDRAAELKLMEADLLEERKRLEDAIILHLSTMQEAPSKLAGSYANITIQQKTKDTWNPEICKQLAGIVDAETFAKLFRVQFTGQKREITKFMAVTDNSEARFLLRDVLVSEPARPYLKYEMAIEEVEALTRQ